jgi:hypothetical protein
MVVLEVAKAAGREQTLADNLLPTQPVLEDDRDLQARAACLMPCLEGLPLESREMIVKYYQGERGTKINNRQKLAEAFSVSPHVLRNRAYRLREKLQDCVDRCTKKYETNSKVPPVVMRGQSKNEA